MRLSRQQLADNEAKIRAAMARLLNGDIPAGGKCDIKTLAREAAVDRAAFYGSRPYARLREEFETRLQARQQAGDFERLSKKEAAKLNEELAKLQLTVGGMRKMKRVPGAVFIIDPHRERIAVTEANKLEVPVVATGDTNVDPDEIDHIIPANDDAIRAIRLLCWSWSSQERIAIT